MNRPKTIERMVAEEARAAKEAWLRLVMTDHAVEHFVRLFIQYLDKQDAITALEARWNKVEEFEHIRGIRSCLQVLIDELMRPIIELEAANEQEARKESY